MIRLIILIKMKTTNAIIIKLIIELINDPYLKVADPTVNFRFDKSTRPKKIPISGLIKLDVNDLTIPVKAEPMITPTAKSITLPRAIKFLNSLNIK